MGETSPLTGDIHSSFLKHSRRSVSIRPWVKSSREPFEVTVRQLVYDRTAIAVRPYGNCRTITYQGICDNFLPSPFGYTGCFVNQRTCHLWQLFLCPQCLQYDCCQTFPLVMGENPPQLQPTEPVQCFPRTVIRVTRTSSLWAQLCSLCEFAKTVKEVAIATITARRKIIFFIVIYPDTCRAQLPNSLYPFMIRSDEDSSQVYSFSTVFVT